MNKLIGLRSLLMMLAVILMATYAYAISPGDFNEKWSKNHKVIEVDKRLDMIRYQVKSYHYYHWRITELKVRPNTTEGSKAWVLKRIVHPTPDAIIISFVPAGATHPLMSFPRDIACLEFHKGAVVVVWRSEDADNRLIDVLLRAEGYCPI